MSQLFKANVNAMRGENRRKKRLTRFLLASPLAHFIINFIMSESKRLKQIKFPHPWRSLQQFVQHRTAAAALFGVTALQVAESVCTAGHSGACLHIST